MNQTESSTLQLTLVNLTGVNDPSWVNSLKAASSAWNSRTLRGRADLQVALEAEDGRHAVVVYNSPMAELAERLRRGVSHTEALVEWQNFAISLIQLHEKYWERMTVVVVPESPQELDILCKDIAERTGIAFSRLDGNDQGHPDIERDVSMTGLQLAALQLLGLKFPRQILNQLEALTLPTREKTYVPDLIEEFMASWTSLQAASSDNRELRRKVREARVENASVSKENSIVVEQLHRTQEDLERRILTNRSVQEKLRGLRRGRDYRKAKIVDLENELIEAQGKIDWLRTVRDEHRDRARQLRAERRQLDSQVQELISERDSIHSSRSWRYTSIFRRTGGNDPES